MTRVPIADQSIRLGQLLKLASVADSGVDARELLEAGEVTVNGEPESRRGRQVRPGDVVAVALPTGTEQLEVVTDATEGSDDAEGSDSTDNRRSTDG